MNICEECKKDFIPYEYCDYQKYCTRKCSRKATNRRATDRKKAYIATYKLNSGCVDCGYNKYACALQFDHLPEYEKVFELSITIVGAKGLESIKEEIKKCEVVCANCHSVRTQERAGWDHRIAV